MFWIITKNTDGVLPYWNIGVLGKAEADRTSQNQQTREGQTAQKATTTPGGSKGQNKKGHGGWQNK